MLPLLSKSGPGTDGNEGVLCIPQRSSITWKSPLRLFSVIYRTLIGGGASYPFAEVQLVKRIYGKSPQPNLVPDPIPGSLCIFFLYHLFVFFFLFSSILSFYMYTYLPETMILIKKKWEYILVRNGISVRNTELGTSLSPPLAALDFPDSLSSITSVLLRYTVWPSRAAVYKFLRVGQHLHVHVKGSIRQRHLCVCPCFSRSVLHFLFVLFKWFLWPYLPTPPLGQDMTQGHF